MLRIKSLVLSHAARETVLGCVMAFAVGFGMMTIQPVVAPLPAPVQAADDSVLNFDLEEATADAAEVEAINAGRFEPYLIDTGAVASH